MALASAVTFTTYLKQPKYITSNVNEQNSSESIQHAPPSTDFKTGKGKYGQQKNNDEHNDGYPHKSGLNTNIPK